MSNLAPTLYTTKEIIWTPLCHCDDNSSTAGPVFDSRLIPRFYLKQGSSTPNNLMGRLRTIWEPCVFWARPSVPLQKVANGDIWFFTERDWSQECCHSNNVVGVILFLLWCTVLVPSLKNTALIFLELFSIQCCDVLVEPPMTSSLFSQKRK